MNLKNLKLIQILSGGMDSVTLLYYLLHNGSKVKALSINYGQRHLKELEYAKYHCETLNTKQPTSQELHICWERNLF